VGHDHTGIFKINRRKVGTIFFARKKKTLFTGTGDTGAWVLYLVQYTCISLYSSNFPVPIPEKRASGHAQIRQAAMIEKRSSSSSTQNKGN
jgi:hypothetical protein